MRSYITGNGINLDTLLHQVRAQIAWIKVVNRQIRPNVTVTVDQLDLAVQEARQSEGQPEYLLSEIVLPVDSPAQAERVAEDAARLVQTLREGASFESLAQQVSAAASAERGGDVGWIGGRARCRPTCVAALERLRAGEIRDPMGSPIGYHIFWLRDQRVAAAPVAARRAAVEVELTQILLPVDGVEDGLAARRDRAGGLRAAAHRLPGDGRGRRGARCAGLGRPRLAAGRRPAAASASAVLGLPVGEVSAPLEGPGGIHLLMVCDAPRAAGAGAEREQIAQRLEQERTERLARRHLRDLRKEAFVEVRL